MIVRPGFKIEKNDCDFLVFVGVGLIKSDNLVASPSILKFASFAFSIDCSPEIDASQRQFVKLTIVSVNEKLTVNP